MVLLLVCLLGKTSTEKNVFFRAVPESANPPPDPNSGNLVLFFGHQNSRFESHLRTLWGGEGDFFPLMSLVAGAWTERKKMYHGGSFLKLADDNMDIQNPEAQNRELSGF